MRFRKVADFAEIYSDKSATSCLAERGIKGLPSEVQMQVRLLRQEAVLLDDVRTELRVRHYSRRTEESYLGWIRRFILFNGKRHPRESGETEIQALLGHLAVERRVSASTQNQAACAFCFSTRTFSRLRTCP